jgi:hypothetical protein
MKRTQTGLPSFSASCFSSGTKGNALDLMVAKRKLKLHAAAIDLYERLGVGVP